MTEPAALTLLKDTEAYLSALHVHTARHDQLAANLACGGCELRERIAEALPELAAAAVPPPAPRADDQAPLRDRIADAIRDAACPGDCGETEEECARTRIQPLVWHRGRLAAVGGEPEMFADAVLAVLAAAPADRGAVFAERLVERCPEHGCVEPEWEEGCHCEIVPLLRRLAVEAPTATRPETCGRTESVDGGTHPPCARPAGHEEAYCRSAGGRAYFLAAGARQDAPSAVPCLPGCIACATDESHDPTPTAGVRQGGEPS